MTFSLISRMPALLKASACIAACFMTATASAGPAASYHLIVLDHDAQVVGLDERGRIGVWDALNVRALRGFPGHLKLLQEGVYNRPGAMNGRGDLAGIVANATDPAVPVIWPHDSPAYRTLEVTTGANPATSSISESGRVGGSLDAQCALWDAAGHLSRVGMPQGAQRCAVTSLNQSSNAVVAFFAGAQGTLFPRAFHWRADGTFTGLPRLPGYESSLVNGSSRDGTLVGSVNRHAVTWFGDVITDLVTDEGWEFSQGGAINDSHDAVGQAFPYQEVPGQGNAVMYSGGHVVPLQPLILPEDLVGVSRLVYAGQINNDGTITGQLETVDGAITHDFVMVPVAP